MPPPCIVYMPSPHASYEPLSEESRVSIVVEEGGGVEPLPLGTLGFKPSCSPLSGTLRMLCFVYKLHFSRLSCYVNLFC